MKGDTLKLNTKRIFILILVSSLLINTAAADDKTTHTTAKSFLQTQVDNMDPSYQPIGQLVADNIVALFLFFGAAFLLYDGLMTSRKKTRKDSRGSRAQKQLN